MTSEHDHDIVGLTMRGVMNQGESVSWDMTPEAVRRNARGGWMRVLPKTSHLAVGAGVAAALIAGLLVGQAGTAPSQRQPATKPTVAVRPSATPSTSSTSTAPTMSPSGAPARCTAAHLTVSLGPGQGATQNWVYPLLFVNSGPSPCSLQGFPGVSFVDASGAQIGSPAAEGRAGEVPSPGNGPVVIGPGKSAQAVVVEGIVKDLVSAGQPCSPVTAAALKVYPPDSTTAFIVRPTGPRASFVLQVCTVGSGRAQVSQVLSR